MNATEVAQAIRHIAGELAGGGSITEAVDALDDLAEELDPGSGAKLEAYYLEEEPMATKPVRYAQEILLRRMEDYSEEYYCAGWMTGLEYDLWDAAHGKPHRGYALSTEEARGLRELAEDAGGWWIWDEESEPERRFVTLEEMRSIYMTHRTPGGR